MDFYYHWMPPSLLSFFSRLYTNCMQCPISLVAQYVDWPTHKQATHFYDSPLHCMNFYLSRVDFLLLLCFADEKRQKNKNNSGQPKKAPQKITSSPSCPYNTTQERIFVWNFSAAADLFFFDSSSPSKFIISDSSPPTIG